jgi:hypothetical protein
MLTLTKNNNDLTPTSIRDQVFEHFPSMSRAKKIKLSTQLIPAMQLAATSAELLSREPISFPDPCHCNILDDYIVLRDEQGLLIASVYSGNDTEMTGHVVFESGEELTTHQRLLLQGYELTNGYLTDCNCKQCSTLIVKQTIEHDSDHLVRSSNHVLTVNLPRELKIKDTSDKLLDAMHDSTLSKDNRFPPRVFKANKMHRDGTTSYYINEQ